MAVDVVLWLIIAAGVTLVASGSVLTAHNGKSGGGVRHEPHREQRAG